MRPGRNPARPPWPAAGCELAYNFSTWPLGGAVGWPLERCLAVKGPSSPPRHPAGLQAANKIVQYSAWTVLGMFKKLYKRRDPGLKTWVRAGFLFWGGGGPGFVFGGFKQLSDLAKSCTSDGTRG